MLHEDSDINESYEEDKPEDFQACESVLSNDEGLCDPDDAASWSNNDVVCSGQ